jgi:hydroxyacyl-ACP dehydratase HTD2-like protein with hotdog domain
MCPDLYTNVQESESSHCQIPSHVNPSSKMPSKAPARIPRAVYRQAPAHVCRRLSSSPSQTAQTVDFDFAKIKHDMLNGQPKLIYEYLSPTSSHLLNVALSDHIPLSYQPTQFQNDTVLPHLSPEALLPQGHHLVYFPFQLPPSRLAGDGADLDHAPGSPFVRRMWAGGSIRFKDACSPAKHLKLDGKRAVCLETIENVTLKNSDIPGKEKIFVDVWRRYFQQSRPEAPTLEEAKQMAQIEERRTLVFMASDDRTRSTKRGGSAQRLGPTRRKPELSFTLTPDPFLLFHFSALSYNAHFIHYDKQWAQIREGYKDLLVHGPLSLTLLFTILRRLLVTQGPGHGGQHAMVESLEYRNLAPLFCGDSMTVCASGQGSPDSAGRRKWDVWVEGPDGGLAVRGRAESVLTDDSNTE